MSTTYLHVCKYFISTAISIWNHFRKIVIVHAKIYTNIRKVVKGMEQSLKLGVEHFWSTTAIRQHGGKTKIQVRQNICMQVIFSTNNLHLWKLKKKKEKKKRKKKKKKKNQKKIKLHELKPKHTISWECNCEIRNRPIDWFIMAFDIEICRNSSQTETETEIFPWITPLLPSLFFYPFNIRSSYFLVFM